MSSMNVKKKQPKRSYSGEQWRSNPANKKRLILDFEHRCAYCDDHDRYIGGSKMYHVEHFAPKEKFPELKFTYDNLLYSCPYCNLSKSNKWPSDSSLINVVNDKGFIDPCTNEYEKHLGRREDGTIYYKTPVGQYMFNEMKLYLQRHQLLYNLDRVHLKVKQIKQEIEKRKLAGKPTEELEEVYKELCVVFCEYYQAFSEEVS